MTLIAPSASPPAAGSALPAFLALTVTAGLGVGVAKIITTLYAVNLGANALEIGVIAGAQSLGLLLMSLPVGLVVERIGPQRLFMFGSLLGGLAYLAAPLAGAVSLLILCTALAGLAMPFRFVSLNTVFLGHIVRLGEARAGWFRGSHMVGVFLLGPLIGGALVTAFGFASAWQVVAGLFFIGAPLAIFGLRSPDDQRRKPGPSTPALSQLRGLLTAPGVTAAAATDLAAQAALLHFTFFITPLAIRQFDMAEARAAQLVSAQGLTFVIALFALGPAAQALGARRGLFLAGVVAAIGEIILATAAAPAALWVGALLIGVGLGMAQVVNLARFARLSVTLGRGQVAGVVALTGPLGGMIGAVGGGLLGRFFGPQEAFAVFAPVLLLLAAASVVRRPFRHSHR